MLYFSCFVVQFEIGKEEAAAQSTAVASWPLNNKSPPPPYTLLLLTPLMNGKPA